MSDEDKALFRQVMKTVKPLKKTEKIVFQTKSLAPKIKRPIVRTIATVTQPTIYLSDYYYETVQSESLLSFCRPGFSTKRLRDLKQGRIPWEARLDLHGLNSNAAQERLLAFIARETANHHRSLLIIHGKGSLNGEAPVLKNLVNHWLPQIPQVSAFHSALPKEGGSGALYVFLKRNNDE